MLSNSLPFQISINESWRILPTTNLTCQSAQQAVTRPSAQTVKLKKGCGQTFLYGRTFCPNIPTFEAINLPSSSKLKSGQLSTQCSKNTTSAMLPKVDKNFFFSSSERPSSIIFIYNFVR